MKKASAADASRSACFLQMAASRAQTPDPSMATFKSGTAAVSLRSTVMEYHYLQLTHSEGMSKRGMDECIQFA